jgi:hypothetical protein
VSIRRDRAQLRELVPDGYAQLLAKEDSILCL